MRMSLLIKNFIFCLLLVCVLIAVSRKVYAETEDAKNLTVVVDGGQAKTARGLFVGYDDNIYVSLIDMQAILDGTSRQYRFRVADGKIEIITEAFDELEDVETFAYERSTEGWTQEERADYENKALSMNEISFNGLERKYYTIVTKVGDYKDCFIQICDFCMLMDVSAKLDGGVITINSGEGMQPVNPKELEGFGFFQCVNSVIVGDATTGEVFYEYKADDVYPIASTTKLMTYLIMAEAVESGRISLDDMVAVSAEGARMSTTSDGLIPLSEGQLVPLRDLICAALIISSNECDHTVSEYVAGSEETVVAMMNDKAASLSMNTAVFYNCNGLPIYSKTLIPAKKQNRMCSRDMFKLASHILINYPQVKEITDVQYMKLDSLDKELKNTNPLLYNLDEVTGLKTGTTNKSGACLVSSLTVNDGSVDHELVVVELGAEGSPDRGRVSELMARYARAVVLGQTQKTEEVENKKDTLSANGIVNMIVNKIMHNQP